MNTYSEFNYNYKTGGIGLVISEITGYVNQLTNILATCINQYQMETVINAFSSASKMKYVYQSCYNDVYVTDGAHVHLNYDGDVFYGLVAIVNDSEEKLNEIIDYMEKSEEPLYFQDVYKGDFIWKMKCE